MEGGKGSRARGERRFGGRFLGLLRGIYLWAPAEGVGRGGGKQPPRPADRILLWKNGEPSRRGMCGAGRWRGARVGRAAGRGVF